MTLFLIAFTGLLWAQSSPQRSLNAQLLHIYQAHPQTFFCEQSFDSKGRLTLRPCRNCPILNNRIQWMMIVSSKELAKGRLCYEEKICSNRHAERYKGLRCFQKMDLTYQQMRRDLHNWVPEISAFCQQRRQANFGIVASKNLTNSCQLYLDPTQKIVEPPPHVRGFIARTYLYMIDKYHLILPAQTVEQFLIWHQRYPVSAWEKERNAKIQTLQGNGNPYITN